MRIALTGASGFLGRYLVHQLAGSGHRLRCWHRPTSDRSGFGVGSETLEWMPGDLGDRKAAATLVRDVDAVVHAAVDWDGPRNRRRESQGDIEGFLQNNLMGSL